LASRTQILSADGKFAAAGIYHDLGVIQPLRVARLLDGFDQYLIAVPSRDGDISVEVLDIDVAVRIQRVDAAEIRPQCADSHCMNTVAGQQR
jgi:hypothetical protein